MQDQPNQRGDLRTTIHRLNGQFKRVDEAAEQIFKIVIGGGMALVSLYGLLWYELPWFFRSWFNGGALFFPSVALVVLLAMLLGGLIVAWEVIAELMPQHPLADEKAHGEAARAKPAQTAAAATGAQREPIHDRKFPD